MACRSVGSIQETIDTRGLLCPHPVLKAEQQSRRMSEGDVLLLVATDPGVLEDIPLWCRVNGHKYLGEDRCGGDIHLRIQLGPTQ